MNNYLHCGTTNKKTIFCYIIALLTLLVYGSYKNIYIVAKRGLYNSDNIKRSVVIILITIIIPIIVDIIYAIVTRKNLKEYLFNSYSLVFSLIYILAMPTRYKFIIYFIGLLLIQVISKIQLKLNINLLCIIKLLVILLLAKNYNYSNIYESTKNIYYNLYDSFFGRTIGGYGSTNIFLIILAYLFLSYTTHYKKEIPALSAVSFTLFGIIYYLIIKESGFNICNDLINTNFLFCIVFISSISFYSPYTTEANILYSVLLGILSFLSIKHISYYEGTILAILILSIFSNVLDKIILKIKR